MRHVFEHAKRLGFKTHLFVTPEIVLRAPEGKPIPHAEGIDFLRELASLDVDYRATVQRNRKGFLEVRISPLASFGDKRGKHARFHKVWNLLLAEGHRPVRER